MSSPSMSRRRIPRVQGPFPREDGSRYWISWVDARGRITIPKELLEELDWRPGDRWEMEIDESDPGKKLVVRNLDAMARKASQEPTEPGASIP